MSLSMICSRRHCTHHMLRSPSDILVILPITRHGLEPERAVKSLEPIQHKVTLVASFNRPLDSAQDSNLLSLLNACHAIILETQTRLTPTQHGCFIFKQCKAFLRPASLQPTTILCDDDELLIDEVDLDLIANQVKRRMAIWGQFEFAGEACPSNLSRKAFYRANEASSYSRLTRIMDEREFEKLQFITDPLIQGSITGLFAPFGAFYAAISFYGITMAVHGVKVENAIIAWRSTSVAEHNKTVARIYLHPHQSGRGLDIGTYLRSDLRYKFYALVNSSSLAEVCRLMLNGFSPLYFIRLSLSLARRGIVRRLCVARKPQ